MHFSHVLGSPYVVYSRSSSCESVMGSGLWGGELVHIVNNCLLVCLKAQNLLIPVTICHFSHFPVKSVTLHLESIARCVCACVCVRNPYSVQIKSISHLHFSCFSFQWDGQN